MTKKTQSDTRAIRPDVAWQSIVDRDGDFDGRFVFAVKTTGVYCRPSCPARQPKRKNVALFKSPTEAEVAGFRACKRCHPASESIEERHLDAVKKACAHIEAAPESLSLNEVAIVAGFSPSHFHRLFKRLVGVTPKAYAAGQRVKRLQKNLVADRTVTDAIYEAGFGSGSRVYESAQKTLGMTPSKYRAGGKNQTIRYTIATSPLARTIHELPGLGLILVGATGKGVCCIEIGDDRETLRESLHQRFPAASLAEDFLDLKEWVAEIVAFIDTPSHGLTLPLDIQGTAFQQRVWQALQKIPVGQTASYRAIAVAIGEPTAQRAVARACGANKLALAIPCHRVVRTNGELGGYRWGVERKSRLLEQEKAVVQKENPRKRRD